MCWRSNLSAHDGVLEKGCEKEANLPRPPLDHSPCRASESVLLIPRPPSGKRSIVAVLAQIERRPASMCLAA